MMMMGPRQLCQYLLLTERRSLVSDQRRQTLHIKPCEWVGTYLDKHADLGYCQCPKGTADIEKQLEEEEC